MNFDFFMLCGLGLWTFYVACRQKNLHYTLSAFLIAFLALTQSPLPLHPIIGYASAAIICSLFALRHFAKTKGGKSLFLTLFFFFLGTFNLIKALA